ncbi:MAG: hypothetical protein AAGD96_36480, partial [Chloroflexota bacterium]
MGELVRVVGAWIGDEPDAASIQKFEQHSDLLWQSVLQQAKDDYFPNIAEHKPVFELDSNGNVVDENSSDPDLWSYLAVEDSKRLKNWLNDTSSHKSKELLVRVFLP